MDVLYVNKCVIVPAVFYGNIMIIHKAGVDDHFKGNPCCKILIFLSSPVIILKDKETGYHLVSKFKVL